MAYILVWPTPESIWKAAEICRLKNLEPEVVVETGRRSVAATLGYVHQTCKNAEIVIVAPFVCNNDVCLHLQEIAKEGGRVYWYGEPEQRVEKELALCCENKLLHLYPTENTSPLKQDIINFIRYKITLTFLGDENGDVNRDELRKAIATLANGPNSISSEEKRLADKFLKFNFPAIEGKSADLIKLKMNIHRVAKAGLNNVLLLGETGTGKEAAAFFLHHLDPCRRAKNFGAINCAGLKEDYLISELFGHVKGAYTDAIDRKGLIASLDGGTLFLDELPDMPSRVQAMLLRFLDNGTYTPMGSDRDMMADVKIIAGGQNELLREKILSKEFRKDLYYRLTGKVLTIPSLRDIIDDLPTLIDHLAYKMEKSEQKRNDTILYFNQRLDELEAYHWPGNIRELANYVRRRLTLGKDENIILGEHEFEDKNLENKDSSRQKRKHQGYCIDVTFSGLLDYTDIDKYRTNIIKFEPPEDVKSRYINHVYKCLKNKGVPNYLIADNLNISINTLKNNIKNR